MARKDRKSDHGASLKIQLRVGGGVVGPGKVQLLETVEREGGISAAAKVMGLSYRRAWYLIDTMNAALGQPVVETKVGGEGGGGASMTPFGSELVRRYRDALGAVDRSAKPFLDWLDENVETDAEADDD
jgi:molybdate transport system regulatory protein